MKKILFLLLLIVPYANAQHVQREVQKNGDVLVWNPIYTPNSELDVVQIDITSEYTKVRFILNNFNSNRTWYNVSKDTYIKCIGEKEKKYKLLDVEGMSLAPATQDLAPNSSVEFSLIFESIPKNTFEICIIDPELDRPSIFQLRLY